MGLEAVKEEIIGNAEKQAESLIAEAKKEADRINKEAEKNFREIEEKSEAETNKLLEQIKKQELTSIKMENKKMLLEAKKNIIEKVFTETKKRIESLDSKTKESYIRKLLEKIKDDIEAAYIYCNKNDIKFLKGILGIDVKPIEICGGLIAENKDRTIRVDYSYDALIDSIKEKELQEISKILFS